jgi:Tfp pilus assembly protein PilO
MGWAEAVFILGFFVAIMAAVIVLGWQGFVTWRSRTSVAREEASRKLAEQATEAQSRTADCLEKTLTELTELRQRTAELERLLKEVD